MDMEQIKAFFDENAGQLFDRSLFSISGTQITIATLVSFVLILVATFWISKIIQRVFVKAMRMRGVDQEGQIGVTRRLVHYSVMAIGIGTGLQTIGIDLTALFAAGAIFAIGLGFAMRNLAENFVSGLILLIERSIKPRDVLYVDGMVVRVVKMGIRATIARSRDDEEVIIPNTALVQSNVINYTLQDSVFRLKTVVGVEYGSDMRVVRKALEDAASALPWRFSGKDALILMTEFGNSSVNFEVSVWIDDPWSARRRLSELNDTLWWALKDAGVTIAFPQLDVHFDAPIGLAQAEA